MADRAGDRSGCTTGGARSAVRLLAVITLLGIVRMRMRRLLVAIRPGMVVDMVVMTGAILVMSHCHALRCRNRGHPLHRNGQRQQKHSKKAGETSRHRRAL